MVIRNLTMLKDTYVIREFLIHLNEKKEYTLLSQEIIALLDHTINEILKKEAEIKQLHEKLRTIKKTDSDMIKNLLDQLDKLYVAYVRLLDDFDEIITNVFVNYKK